MATVLRVEVHFTVLDYKAISIPPAPGVPSLPIVIPSAVAAGVLSLSGPVVSGTDLRQENEYRALVRFLVQARLGNTFDVSLLDSASYPNLNPPPWWKLVPEAHNYNLLRHGAIYTEEMQGQNATAYIGYCISVAPA